MLKLSLLTKPYQNKLEQSGVSLLLVNQSHFVEGNIILKLIPKGIEVYSAKNVKEAMYLIRSIYISHVFMDIDTLETDWLSFYEEMIKNPDTANIHFIPFTSNCNKEFIEELVKNKILFCVSKKNSIEHFVNKLDIYISKTSILSDRRRQIRVNTPSENSVSITINIYNRTINLKVINLSLEGAAFRIENPSDAIYFSENQVINGIQLNIDNSRIVNSAKIVRFVPIRNYGALIFLNPYKEIFQQFISRYIYNVLSIECEEFKHSKVNDHNTEKVISLNNSENISNYSKKISEMYEKLDDDKKTHKSKSLKDRYKKNSSKKHVFDTELLTDLS